MKSFITTLLFGLLLINFSGLDDNIASEKKPFSHKLHKEQDADCSDCHKPDLSFTEESCAQCHDEPMLDKTILNDRSSKKAAKFDHGSHGKLECLKCHESILKADYVSQQPELKYSECEKCHTESKVSVAENHCKKCHVNNFRHKKPAYHLKTWTRRHGKKADFNAFGDHEYKCDSCHKNGSCKSCHREMKPLSHNGLWRVRMHGKAASWDKATCKTCHETGTCVRCHRNSKPVNHMGSWVIQHAKSFQSSNVESCQVCHNSSWTSSCSSCHKGK